VIRRDLANELRPLHREDLVGGQGLAGRMAKGEMNGLGLGAHPVAAHDYVD